MECREPDAVLEIFIPTAQVHADGHFHHSTAGWTHSGLIDTYVARPICASLPRVAACELGHKLWFVLLRVIHKRHSNQCAAHGGLCARAQDHLTQFFERHVDKRFGGQPHSVCAITLVGMRLQG